MVRNTARKTQKEKNESENNEQSGDAVQQTSMRWRLLNPRTFARQILFVEDTLGQAIFAAFKM
jgi:hypothetical protein